MDHLLRLIAAFLPKPRVGDTSGGSKGGTSQFSVPLLLRGDYVTMIESTSLDFPATLCHEALDGSYACIWTIGNLDIHKIRPIGFFCSTKGLGSVISGFHSPMERECLDLLLRGRQPVVLCPARDIEHIRLPAAWRTPIAEGRMLVLSPFGAPPRRPTADLAEQRNLLVSTLADTVVIAHAHSGSKIDRLYTWIAASGKRVYTLDLPENADPMHHRVPGYAVPALIDCLLDQ